MKKVVGLKFTILLFAASLVLACSSEESTLSKKMTVEETVGFNGNDSLLSRKMLDCPEGTTKVLMQEFVTHKLHRASSGCSARFSICSQYKWVEVCVDDWRIPTIREEYHLLERTTTVSIIVLPNRKLLFNFPVEIMNDPEFTSADFTSFGFDTDYDVNGMTVIAGDYTPVITNDQIQITVDIR